MTYSIFDAGNLVVSFDRKAPARAELNRLAEQDDDARGRLLLVAFDAAGDPVEQWVPGVLLPHAA